MNCPLCNSDKNEPIYEKIKHSITSDSDLIEEDTSNLICSECGNVFNESGSRKKTVEFYSNSYKLLDVSSEAEFKFYYQNESIGFSNLRLNNLINNVGLNHNGTILDIGCGKGNFLLHFSKKFPNWNLFGVEISKAALKMAKDKLTKATFHEGFFNSKVFEQKFDLIVSLGVLEHLEDPNSFLQDAVDCLSENGILFFDVPNFKLFPFDLFVYDHLSHFTKETLTNLLYANNLYPEKIVESIDKVPLFVVAKKSKLKHSLSNYYYINKKLIEDHVLFNNGLLETYESACKNNDRIGIFGLGMGTLIGLQKSKLFLDKVECFFDENDFLVGSIKLGKEIRHLNEVKKNPKIPLVFSMNPCYIETAISKLEKIGVRYLVPQNYQYFRRYFNV